MSLPVNCSNILLNQPFTTANDFTVSFTYTMNTSGTDTTTNYGFSVFFIDGGINSLTGGGTGPGLGVVSSTGNAVNGVFATIGFDITGLFSKILSIPPFTTGNTNQVTNSIGLRVSPNFTFAGSYYIFPINPYLYGPLGPETTAEAYQTVRVSVRKNFTEIDVYSLANETYVKLATFNLNLSALPSTAKMGIGYSGDTFFEVQNITVNYTWVLTGLDTKSFIL